MRIIYLFIAFYFIIPPNLTAQCVSGNCSNGKGTFLYPNGTIYIGEFRNSKANGEGICYYTNQSRYTGEWREHNFHGKGTFYKPNGEVIMGRWAHGKLIDKFEQKGASRSLSLVEAPKVWAVIVGVAQYKHYSDLHYTDDDAYRMYAFMKSPEGGALPDNQISLLIDENATKRHIINQMNQVFVNASENDVVLFYFSGHGLEDGFLPSDYDGIKNKLRHNEISAIFSQSKAKHKICIADACHAGGWVNNDFSIATKNSGEKMKTTGYQDMIESYYEAFSQSNGGMALLLSSKAKETSIENNGLRQGVFSHFLIKGLKGEADFDNNQIVTIEELFSFVEKGVVFYTNNRQTPIIYGNYDKAMPVAVRRR